MKAFIDNLTNNLTDEDITSNPFLYDEKALDMEVQKYCLDNDFIYYTVYGEVMLQALDHVLKREYIRELYNELDDFKNLSPLVEVKDKNLSISLLKNYKIFNRLTQYDYHLRFGDYFTDEDMRLIESNREEN